MQAKKTVRREMGKALRGRVLPVQRGQESTRGGVERGGSEPSQPLLREQAARAVAKPQSSREHPPS